MDYSSLKSGTDIRGIATSLGGKEVNLTSEAVYDITAAFVVWYINKFEKSPNELLFAVGHDSRITGEEISSNVRKALINAGVNVLDFGLCSTPAMFMSTIDLRTDAAIEITASHHPFDRNGLKFFTREGGLDGSDISEIVKLANNGEEIICNCAGTVANINFMSLYAGRLRRMICEAVGKSEKDLPLKGYKIVVDAGNGVGGFYARDVLAKLGADIEGSKFLEPDGMFPNHIPNPEDKTAMKSICDAVKESGADLGLIFDTDVDRAGCVDKFGKEINRNRLIALAAYISSKGKENAYIVTDSVTSDGLKDFLQNELGCTHYRYRRGYKNVINKAIELTNEGKECPLAIETSGHAALKENFFLDDGAYLVTKIVIELALGTDINAIVDKVKMPAEEKEVRFDIKTPDFKAYGEKIIKDLEQFTLNNPEKYTVADDNREGIRVSTESGWFLLRLSVHDPVMPMNFENEKTGGINKDIEGLKDFFASYTELNSSSLEN